MGHKPAPRKSSKKNAPLEPLAFSEVERLNLLRLAAEVRAANLQLAAKQREADDFYKSIDPEGKFKLLLGEVNAWKQAIMEHSTAYNEVAETASKRLGIDFKTHTWDPETGVVREIVRPVSDGENNAVKE
jgi:hypothetical protein